MSDRYDDQARALLCEHCEDGDPLATGAHGWRIHSYKDRYGGPRTVECQADSSDVEFIARRLRELGEELERLRETIARLEE